jgi:GntR family transcriptional regulator
VTAPEGDVPDRSPDRPGRVAARPLRYRQIYRSIADRIASGDLSAGDRLQGERDLSVVLGVGRTTVRRALAELERDGLIESLPGRGTFVAGGPISESNALVGLSELGAARGLRTTSIVIRAETRPATVEESDVFVIAPGAPLFQLERVRLLDGLELALADTLVPEGRAPGIADVDFGYASLYAELDARGASPVRAEYTVWATGADERMAGLIAVKPGDPVLVTSTRAFDARGRVVETSIVTYRADRYRMRTELVRRRWPRPVPRGG